MASRAQSLRSAVRAKSRCATEEGQQPKVCRTNPQATGLASPAQKVPATAEETSQSRAPNLDNDCRSCLIFPEKDGTFAIPQAEPSPVEQQQQLQQPEVSTPTLRPIQPEEPADELEQLMKNYNEQRKEYINKVTEKLSSYNCVPSIPVCTKEAVTLDSLAEDRRRSSAENSTASPSTYSPMCAGTKTRAPTRSIVEHYASNIANIVSNNTRTINSAYYQTRKGTRPAGADVTSSNFRSGTSGKFPREIFSLNCRTRKHPF